MGHICIVLLVTVLLSNSCDCLLCGKTGTAADWYCLKDALPAGTTGSAIDADSCFCVLFQNQTQKEAFDSCETFGGFLTDIQNVDENTLIGQILTNATAENQTSSSTTTVAGATTAASVSSSASPCGANAVSWNNTCYAYSGPGVRKTWANGDAYCSSTYTGGHLASVDTTLEQDFLGNLTQNCTKCPIYGYFVGGNNYGNKTNWRWSNGKAWVTPKVTNNSAWGKQPDDPQNQQCVVLVQYDNGWGDWYCTWSLPYVCAFPMPSAAAAVTTNPTTTVATKVTPTPPPAWIGLYLTAPGLMWSKSSNCPMTSATGYENLNQATQSLLLSGYVYGNNQKWANANATSKMTAAVCRMDRDICGRGLCPSCSTCTANNNGNCYTCAE